MVIEVGSLWLLRHGQSIGNVANDAAREGQLERLELADRDMDVALSDLGRRQATVFGAWLADQPEVQRPQVVVSSPYLRAMDTARLVAAAGGISADIIPDERLREREFGILDLLTHRGVVAKYPDEAVRRDHVGKFYYRPPGGESWVDVALRLRSLRDSLAREHTGKRVLVVAHEVPIIIMRYLIQRLDEDAALELSRSRRLANCSLTTFERRGDELHLDRDAWVTPLETADAPITDESDPAIAPR